MAKSNRVYSNFLYLYSLMVSIYMQQVKFFY